MHIPVGTILELYGNGSPFNIDLTKHGFVLGKTGTGKSVLLERIFLTAIRRGLGGAFFDPHGTSADNILRHIPRHRQNDVVLVDLLTGRVPGMNMLEGENPDLRLNQFIDLLAHFYGSTSWLARSDYISRNLGRGVMNIIPDCTGLHIAKALTDDAYRASLAAKTKDAFILDFFKIYDDTWSAKQRDEAASAPLNKIDILNHPLVRVVIGQKKGLNLKELMDQRKILIFRLPLGEISQSVAAVIGAIATAMIRHGAMERKITKDSPQFIVVADEIQNFVRGFSHASFLAEVRKFKVSYFGGTQIIESLPEGAATAFFGNADNILVTRVGAEDAERVSHELRSSDPMSPPASTIQGLRVPDQHGGGYWYGKTATKSILFQALPPMKKEGDEAWLPTLIRQSLQMWGEDKQTIERQLQSFMTNR
jgi:hypothetical protein